MIIRAVFMTWSIIILTSRECYEGRWTSMKGAMVTRVNAQVLENAEGEYFPSINESLPFQIIFSQLNICNLDIT